MIKRIIAGAAAAGFAATLLVPGSASAACSAPSSTAGGTAKNVVGPVTVYRQVGPSGGYVGVGSSAGFVEGNGTPDGGGNGHVSGSITGTPAPAYFKVGSESPTVCVAGQSADAPA